MKKLIPHLLTWGIGACRVAVGLLVMNTGVDLMQRHGSFALWNAGGAFTGIFLVVLGGIFITLGIFPKLFDSSE